MLHLDVLLLLLLLLLKFLVHAVRVRHHWACYSNRVHIRLMLLLVLMELFL
jgi:hypothetical protein